MTKNARILLLEKENPGDLEIYATAIAREMPAVPIVSVNNEIDALAAASTITAIVAKAPSISRALVEAMPRLNWIQALTTGTDNLDRMDLPASVTITSARGMHGPQMSELAVMLMMALARDLPRMLANQARGVWQRWPQTLLMGKTAVLVGVGTISEELATRCRAHGMRVIGVSAGRSEVSGFDKVYARSDLLKAAAQADFLIALVPYDQTTHHLIGSEVLNAMPPGGRLVNISRGKVVDEDALLAAVTSGTIAGAALDVFSLEPLPSDSPFWTLPNVIVTPHIGGMSDNYARQLLPLVLENLRAYLLDAPHRMRNLLRLGSTKRDDGGATFAVMGERQGREPSSLDTDHEF